MRGRMSKMTMKRMPGDQAPPYHGPKKDGDDDLDQYYQYIHE